MRLQAHWFTQVALSPLRLMVRPGTAKPEMLGMLSPTSKPLHRNFNYPMIDSWILITDDWMKYMEVWRDQFEDYGIRGKPLWCPVYEHIWHGETWKLPEHYSLLSQRVARRIGENGRMILELYNLVEDWIAWEYQTPFKTLIEIQKIYREAKHYVLLERDKREIEWRRLEEAKQPVKTQTPEINPMAIKSTSRKNSRSKKVQGETLDSDLLFSAALIKHHGYENDICTSFVPLSCTNLASSLGRAKNSASLFFLKKFKGHKKYVNMCSDSSLLNTAMKMLSGEASSPHILLGDAARSIKGKPDPESDL